MTTDTATLEQRLAEAEDARHWLLTGRQTVTVQASGDKQITYARTELRQLDAYIAELKRRLGQSTGRRAVGTVF